MKKDNCHRLILALGSNTDQRANIHKAAALLSTHLNIEKSSSAIWTAPIGMDGSDRFLNQLLLGTTTLPEKDFHAFAKQIENVLKREQGSNRITIDIDILQFDNRYGHPDDWQRPYIQLLMKEIE